VDKARQPAWLWRELGVSEPREGARFDVRDQPYVMQKGIPRSATLVSSTQASTGEKFGYKWQRTTSFDSEPSRRRMREWLIERYGDLRDGAWIARHGTNPLVIDAGCGAALSGIELFGPVIDRIRYLGVDISAAIDVAAARFAERGMAPGLVQSDICRLPLAPASVDMIFSEGVLHHTDSTENAIRSLAPLLKPGGVFMFYVYRLKGPVREFTDDYIREKLQAMSPEEGWKALEPLTRLGIALGDLDREIDIREPIDLLGIPAGRMSVQRFFYWHVAKAFHHPELSFDEMNHINFDWYAPRNAHRQTIEQVRAWCRACKLEIEREVVEEAGITIAARRTG
jgi:arsenite methyltransferase